MQAKREDNGKELRCEASNPALEGNLVDSTTIRIECKLHLSVERYLQKNNSLQIRSAGNRSFILVHSFFFVFTSLIHQTVRLTLHTRVSFFFAFADPPVLCLVLPFVFCVCFWHAHLSFYNKNMTPSFGILNCVFFLGYCISFSLLYYFCYYLFFFLVCFLLVCLSNDMHRTLFFIVL